MAAKIPSLWQCSTISLWYIKVNGRKTTLKDSRQKKGRIVAENG